MTITSWQLTDRPLIIGHRGASAAAPENTLAACALAMGYGADGIELDVRLSADGWPVVIHDAEVDRVALSATGTVSNLTVSELQQIDLGHGQTVPTLDDLFELLGRQPLYNIELKSLGMTDLGLEAAVADRIAAHNLNDRVLVSSFDPLSLRRIRSHLPQSTPLGFLHEHRATRFLGQFIPAQADHPHSTLVDAEYINWAHSRGYLINVWTVDDPDEMLRLAQLGVNAIITNKPDLACEVLNVRS